MTIIMRYRTSPHSGMFETMIAYTLCRPLLRPCNKYIKIF